VLESHRSDAQGGQEGQRSGGPSPATPSTEDATGLTATGRCSMLASTRSALTREINVHYLLRVVMAQCRGVAGGRQALDDARPVH